MKREALSRTSEEQARRDGLIEDYREFVHGIVHKLIRSMGLPSQLYDDFVSAGYLGLVEAAERFDFNAGVEFRHFAFRRIRGAVIDSIRESSELSGKAYRYARALEAVHELSESSVRDSTGLSGDQLLAGIFDFAAKAGLVRRMTLSAEGRQLEDLPSPEESIEEKMSQRQTLRVLRDIVETLPEKERTILREYYFEGKSFVQVARRYGDSKSWVSRLHARAIELLKEKFLEACKREEDGNPTSPPRRRTKRMP